MKQVKRIAIAAVLAMAAGWAAAGAAQDANTSERTFLTFSAPIELPGLRLEAGTYVFKLADTPSRNVVQVWNREENQILGQWLFVPAQRHEVSQDNVVMFKEEREGATPAVQFWYYPGERIGKEFVYPKDQAQQIAARSGQRVLTSEGGATVSSIDAQGTVTEWKPEPSSPAPGAAASANTIQGNPPESESAPPDAPATAQPSAPAGSLAGNRGVTDAPRRDTGSDTGVSAQASAQGETPSAATPPDRAVGTSGTRPGQPAQAETQVGRADTLPRTASPLPFSALIGLLSLVAAAGVHGLRRLHT